jgi:diguanylate cyclase (GGDEF)-like protein
MSKLLSSIGYEKKMNYKDKLLYFMVLSTILVAGFYLVIYFLFIPFQPAIIAHCVYVLFGISLFFFLKNKHYSLVKYAMIIAHMIQLTLAVFVWFPVSTGYHLYYFMVPMASFLVMSYDNTKERLMLTILSILSTILYFLSATIPLKNFFYQTSSDMNRFLSGMSILTTMLPMIYIFNMFTKESYLNRKELVKLANTDALTQIMNRKVLYEQGIEEFDKVKKLDETFTLLIFDIDYFKRVNDQYGHPVGDKLLQELTALVMHHIRKEDTLSRYGGEEFAILLRNANHEIGYTIAEKLLFLIREHSFTIDGHDIQISVSIGVTSYTSELKDFDQMMKIADKALYKAKNNGRNQVLSAS